MRDDINKRIKAYVSEQIDVLNKELEDKTLYMRNNYPNELSSMENIKEGDEEL
jgi:hypothetical protein